MRIFKEEQRFNQLWIIILIIISMLVPVGIIIGMYIKKPNSFTALEFFIIMAIIIIASSIVFIFKLSTKIDEFGIHYKFFPFHLKYKRITWNEINKAYVRKYDALTEYGGWGLKGGKLWNKSKGIAVNVSGDIGIQLELKTDKKVLIGTLKQEDAKSVLANYKTKINNNG